MWRYNLSPRPQSQRGLSLDCGACELSDFIASLLAERETPQFEFHFADFIRFLRGRDRGQQSLNAIQGSVSIIGAERLLVRPSIADFQEFINDAYARLSLAFGGRYLSIPGQLSPLALRRRVAHLHEGAYRKEGAVSRFANSLHRLSLIRVQRTEKVPT